MENENDQIRWVVAKKIMRIVFEYNNFNRFLDELSCLPSEIGQICTASFKDLGTSSYRPAIHFGKIRELSEISGDNPPWKNDDLFPLTPLSDELLMKVKFDEAGEVDLSAEGIGLLKDRLRLSGDRRGIAVHKTPNWSYWNRLEYWSSLETAFLLFEEEPDPKAFSSANQFWYDEEGIKRLNDIIIRAFHAGQIRGFEKEGTGVQIYTKTGTLGPWAMKQHFFIPSKLNPVIYAFQKERDLYRRLARLKGMRKLSDNIDLDELFGEEIPLSSNERQELGRLNQGAIETAHNGISRKEKPLRPRAETTYLNIIGELLEVILGNSPGKGKHPDFVNQAELIEHLSDLGMPGLSKSNLEAKFAQAKRAIESVD